MDTLKQPRWESAIYKGFVRHRRFTPKFHEFNYPLFMLLIKLDELPELAENLQWIGLRFWHWARFKRSDYVGDAQVSVSESVKQKIAAKVGCPIKELEGDVYLLGHLRYLGMYFSPLNLYFLKQGNTMRYMLAEVSNTPWNRRHYYVVDLQDIQPHEKAFHVSPFNPMEQMYNWRIKPPSSLSKKSMIHLEVSNKGTQEATDIKDNKVFDATMVLKRLPLNQSQLNRVLISTPAQTASMVVGIYWQALKLFIKGVPFYPHPSKQDNKISIKEL